MNPAAKTIAALIDHTLLRPDATRQEIVAFSQQGLEHCFASVCVNSYWVPVVAAELEGTSVKVCSVVGFPFGVVSTEAKVAEARAAFEAGAREFDMVQNVGAFLSGEFDKVEADIAAVVDTVQSGAGIVKVILETALLDDAQKVRACEIAKKAGARFVKTSTGFGPSGATTHDVALIRRTVGHEMGVKASGGIRTIEDLQKMVQAGANRIGASCGVQIIQGLAGASQRARVE